MRIMGLDYGSKTIGVAISDSLGITAQGIEVIERKEENKLRKSLARLEQLIEEYEVGEIVLGYPKNMNNTLGDRIARTEEFKEHIERRTGLKVTFWDERLTSVAAEKAMLEGGLSKKQREARIDKIAAAFILQGYLDFCAHQKEQN